MKIAAIIIAVILGAVLLVHDAPYLLTSEGRCIAAQQPAILLGGSPGLLTALGCIPAPGPAGAPAPAPAPALPAPAPVPASRLPRGAPAAQLTAAGATHPPGRLDVYCLHGASYLQAYGPANGWFADHDDPSQSPCRNLR